MTRCRLLFMLLSGRSTSESKYRSSYNLQNMISVVLVFRCGTELPDTRVKFTICLVRRK